MTMHDILLYMFSFTGVGFTAYHFVDWLRKLSFYFEYQSYPLTQDKLQCEKLQYALKLSGEENHKLNIQLIEEKKLRSEIETEILKSVVKK